jgi:hypothetical protein
MDERSESSTEVRPLGSTRLSLRGSSPLEARLLEASERSWKRSLERVATWFPNLDAADDVASSGTKTVRLMDVPQATLDRLDAIRIFDHAVTHSDLTNNRLRLVPAGADGDETSGGLAPGRTPTTPRTVDGFGSVAALQAGRTLVNNQVEALTGGAIYQLTCDLAEAYRGSVGMNTYLSFGASSPGFGRHWDDHDVIIIQIVGTKYWEVHQPQSLAPARPFTSDDEAGKVAWSGLLEPGQALCIPRGWAHTASGIEDEPSFHLTVSNVRQTGVDALSRSLRAATSPLALPDLATTSDLDADELLDQGMASWRAELPVLDGTGPVRALLAERDDFARCGLRLRLPGGIVFGRDTDDGDQLSIAANLWRIPLSTDGVAVVEALLDHEVTSVEALVSDIGTPPERIAPTLRLLARAGVLSVTAAV